MVYCCSAQKLTKKILAVTNIELKAAHNPAGVQNRIWTDSRSSDTITINPPMETPVRHLLESTSNIGASGQKGFYEEYSIPSYRQISA